MDLLVHWYFLILVLVLGSLSNPAGNTKEILNSKNTLLLTDWVKLKANTTCFREKTLTLLVIQCKDKRCPTPNTTLTNPSHPQIPKRCSDLGTSFTELLDLGYILSREWRLNVLAHLLHITGNQDSPGTKIGIRGSLQFSNPNIRANSNLENNKEKRQIVLNSATD